MAIVIEDGTVLGGSPPPNSYATIAQFKAFYSDRGNDTLGVDTDNVEIEAALIKATDYMAQRLRMLWKGSRVAAFQSLDWPRRGVDVPDFFDPFFRNVNVPVSFQDTVFVPEDQVPREIRDAQIFLAGATIDSNGISSVEDLQGTIGRTTRVEQVGSLKVEYFGAEQDGQSGRVTEFYYNAMRRVEPFILASAPHTGRVVRS